MNGWTNKSPLAFCRTLSSIGLLPCFQGLTTLEKPITHMRYDSIARVYFHCVPLDIAHILQLFTISLIYGLTGGQINYWNNRYTGPQTQHFIEMWGWIILKQDETMKKDAGKFLQNALDNAYVQQLINWLLFKGVSWKDLWNETNLAYLALSVHKLWAKQVKLWERKQKITI